MNKLNIKIEREQQVLAHVKLPARSVNLLSTMVPDSGKKIVADHGIEFADLIDKAKSNNYEPQDLLSISIDGGRHLSIWIS